MTAYRVEYELWIHINVEADSKEAAMGKAAPISDKAWKILKESTELREKLTAIGAELKPGETCLNLVDAT